METQSVKSRPDRLTQFTGHRSHRDMYTPDKVSAHSRSYRAGQLLHGGALREIPWCSQILTRARAGYRPATLQLSSRASQIMYFAPVSIPYYELRNDTYTCMPWFIYARPRMAGVGTWYTGCHPRPPRPLVVVSRWRCESRYRTGRPLWNSKEFPLRVCGQLLKCKCTSVHVRERKLGLKFTVALCRTITGGLRRCKSSFVGNNLCHANVILFVKLSVDGHSLIYK